MRDCKERELANMVAMVDSPDMDLAMVAHSPHMVMAVAQSLGCIPVPLARIDRTARCIGLGSNSRLHSTLLEAGPDKLLDNYQSGSIACSPERQREKSVTPRSPAQSQQQRKAV